MNSLLAEILVEKRKEVDRIRERWASTNIDNNIPPIRDFKAAISQPGKINLIAEIKFASPSTGIIHTRKDTLKIGQIYEENGAAAISLLTDNKFFGGDINDLPRLKKAISLPILRKDFIIDEIQVTESFLYGADAILLIARILSRQQLKRLLDTCQEWGLDSLIEVHDRYDLEKAIECRAEIIGINNRNLDSFEVNLTTTIKLVPLVPENHIIVSESGIRTGKDIQLLRKSGVRAVLVGSSILKSDNVAEKVRELVLAGRMCKMVRVKICGITNPQDASMAVEMGVDALGFIFAPGPRQITPEKARDIICSIPPFVQTIGVFVDTDHATIRRIIHFCGLDLVQLHGDESPEICDELMPYTIKVFRLRDESSLGSIKPYCGKVRAILFDTYSETKRGGTGKTSNWGLAIRGKAFGMPIILSGGLKSSNIERAISTVEPYAVDICSGIEDRPGKKNYRLMKELMETIRKI